MSENREVNTIGRIPGVHYYSEEQKEMEKKIYTEEEFVERITGKFRGYTQILGACPEGIRIRTDSYSVPEMWLEAILPWSSIEEALEERNRSHSE